MSDATGKLIEAAAAAAGGDEQLATYLNIEPLLLLAYYQGRRPMPDFLFLRAVDLILASLAKPSKPEESEPPEKPLPPDLTRRAA